MHQSCALARHPLTFRNEHWVDHLEGNINELIFLIYKVMNLFSILLANFFTNSHELSSRLNIPLLIF